MTNALAGKNALVTDSSRGIGRAIARRLAKDRATVIIHCVRNAKAAQEVVEAILEEGAKRLSGIGFLGRENEKMILLSMGDKNGSLPVLCMR